MDRRLYDNGVYYCEPCEGPHTGEPHDEPEAYDRGQVPIDPRVTAPGYNHDTRPPGRYAVHCDICHEATRRTDSLPESVAGGRHPECATLALAAALLKERAT